MSLPREGVPCRCEAHESAPHIHINDEVFTLVLDENVPRGTMLLGEPGRVTPMAVDAAMLASWGISEAQARVLADWGPPSTKPRKPTTPTTCPHCGAKNPTDPCSNCGARSGGPA